MEYVNFFINLLSTVIGGIILAIIFFWSREHLFALPNITGNWIIEIETKNTSYNPYQGMILRYSAAIWTEGPNIEGTIEKIYEKSSTCEREFIGKDRTRGVVKGYIEKHYFSCDKINLHVVENGHGRESTYFYSLLEFSDKSLKGEFTSMVADQNGKATWIKKEL